MRNIKAGAILLASCLWALQSNALNILLTNDDGYQHPWIRTVYKA